jgi:hypothetical protein
LYPGGESVKLTRKAIAEGLEAVPIDTVILGASNSREKRLTAKQREFARQIALGETKAGAYRKSRETKAKPETASRRGQDLAKNSAVAAQIDAFRLAIEAERSRTPAHLRALTIHELTKHALDENFPPAQRVKALELLGKITEVALFTERREVVQVKDSGEIRERLMDSIRLAIKSSAQDVEVIDADSLLAEINGAAEGEADAMAQDATPPGATPLFVSEAHPQTVHSNPHTQSAENGSPTEITNEQPNV